MALTVAQIQAALTESQAVGDAILKELELYVPSAMGPEVLAGTVLDLLAKYGSLAVGAFAGANGIPITPESVAALVPDQDPLPPPPSV
jgi:hypothetical protein